MGTIRVCTKATASELIERRAAALEHERTIALNLVEARLFQGGIAQVEVNADESGHGALSARLAG
ncbi:MAG: hypothetical protein HC937_01740 [Aquincola sp.]|nr:hypothetical protein [Aquincola sp.]